MKDAESKFIRHEIAIKQKKKKEKKKKVMKKLFFYCY